VAVKINESQLPLLTPDSDWRPPSELPDLRGRPLVAIDTEEKDDGLAMSRGPGWPYRSGYVCGVSYATEDGLSGYVPLRHPDTECFDQEQVRRWLQDLVKSRTPLLFQNAPFDLGWMHADLGVDIPPEYPLEDTLCAAFMVNEDEYEYNLDAICARLGLPGKDETLMREAANVYLRPAHAPKSWKLTGRDLKSNLYRLPGRYVGPYAAVDSIRALQAFARLRPIMREQRLDAAYRLEMDLVPTVRRMRSRGIAVNEDRATQTRDEYRARRDAILSEMTRRLPGRGDVGMERLRSHKWMETIFTDERVPFPRTPPTVSRPEGTPSFKSEWMEKYDHWLPKMAAQAMEYDRFAEYFMGDIVLGFAHRGRIHAEIHQYKSDDGGTVSYRFAYSDPPLQQAPSPDMNPELGGAFRDVFEADGLWGANDYSQQEYRLTAHFAAVCKVRGGEEAVRRYQEDPNLDFHQMVADLTGLSRGKAKIQNFALLFGQGRDATAARLGVSLEEADEIRETVTARAPFGPALNDYCQRRAQQVGYLRLLDGARVRFDEWEAAWVPRDEWARGQRENRRMEPCSLEEARARRADESHPWHGCRLRRAGVRKALNRLIQGSAARQTKLAMRACAREGLTPILQMHDELDHDEDSESKILLVAEIMRDVVRLRLPMKVDTGVGRTWREAKSKDLEKTPVVTVRNVPQAGDPAKTPDRVQHGARRLRKLINGPR
jgi:DNA polymerase I-like protein with 3'-5' exonuclease and polymerase domains